MKIFLDTSSLFKLYHRESDTSNLERELSTIKISGIYLSEITKVEFTSTMWKKVRTKDITESEARKTLELFDFDFEKYNFVTTTSIIIEQARHLISKYGTQGLRTLDSIQLSTAVSIFGQAEIFFTADILLKSLFVEERLPTYRPGN